jgi:urease accessory protein
MNDKDGSVNLALLQMADSALPIGSYSNSWGMETWVQEKVVSSAKEAEEAVMALLRLSIAPSDGASSAIAHRCATANDTTQFAALNAYLTANKWNLEICQASERMGERLRALAISTGWISDFPDVAPIHHSAVFGWLGASLLVPLEDTVLAYLFSAASSLVSACVRLVPLGHTDGQRIVTKIRQAAPNLLPVCLTRQIQDLGGFAPMQEWACRQHENLYSRLFQS